LKKTASDLKTDCLYQFYYFQCVSIFFPLIISCHYNSNFYYRLLQYFYFQWMLITFVLKISFPLITLFDIISQNSLLIIFNHEFLIQKWLKKLNLLFSSCLNWIFKWKLFKTINILKNHKIIIIKSISTLLILINLRL
jgi:hypothetical protein